MLREILERDLCGNARVQGDRLRRRLPRDWRRSTASSATSAARGCFQAIEFVRDLATKEPFPAEMAFGVQVGRRALENGLLCRFDPHWIAFGPPLVSTAEQIDEMVAILDRSLGQVLDEMAA